MQNKNLIKVLGESLKNWLSAQNQKWHQEQRQLQLQLQAQNISMGQIYVQEALGQVLHTAHILPNLTPIESCTNLVPCGYTIGETPVYSYRWLKKSPDKISSTTLELARQKINSAIELEIRKMTVVYQNLLDEEKPFFVQQYPAFYLGFQVIGIKDAGTDVIITVAYK